MKHLLLHAGTHKTGTTTIQRALRHSAKMLRNNGFYYPALTPELGPRGYNHNIFGHAYGNRPEMEQSADGWARRVYEQTSDREIVIISAESMYRHLRGDAKIPRPERRRIYLSRVAEVLEDFRVSVVLFFRRRDRCMESVFHERAANGQPNGSFEQFVQKHKVGADYQFQIEIFRAVFGDVRAISYEIAADEGLLNCFARVAGCPPLDFIEPSTRQSTDARISLWMESKCRQDGGDEQAAKQRRAFSHSPCAKDLFADFGQVTLWDEGQRRDFLSEFGEEPVVDHRPVASSSSFSLIDEAFSDWKASRDLE